MENIHEFDSPFVPSPLGVPSDLTPEPAVSKMTGQDKNQALIRSVETALNADPAFRSLVIMALEMPPKKRDALRRSLRFWWHYLTGIERGKVVKGFKAELRDEDVAALAGFSREKLITDDGFKDLKRMLATRPLMTVKRRNGRRFDMLCSDDCNSPDN
jgi:hypothetical protein